MKHTLAVGLLLLIPFLSPLPLRGLSRLLPRPEVSRNQTVVILGRGPDSQADFALAAANLWADHPSLDIFVSGMTDAPEIIKLLKDMGVPETQIKGERCSQTTWENGLFSELLLEPGEEKRIILVTDNLHITRALLVFQGFGFKVETSPAQLEYPDGSIVANLITTNRMALREYAALIYYTLSGRFRPLPTNSTSAAEAEARAKVSNWGCYLVSGIAEYSGF